ncbi:LacI family DNA-binding transcriptional regulator [Cohnella thermotolerans]|uniref:LacI family DNA-binding transcriptional regulator n=1 Tax=Cohnella thermotolerans TaxID=329858 RepID=UPI0004274BF5|nr:LacI family DNA-binding transcriptional regulator [Cohnella thermotolerans]
MNTTIYDIAARAEVSIATVSKVINGSGRISLKTRAKVVRIMQELGYQPSRVASALTGKQTFTLGLLLPDLANPFFAEMARSIEDRAYEMGFSVIICSTDNKLERTERNIRFFKQKRLDGVMIGTGDMTAAAITGLSKSMPVALIARDIPTLAIDAVRVDDFLGGRMAAAHLLESGHTRIAVIAEDELFVSSLERVRGYRTALEEAGITFDPGLVVQVNPDPDKIKSATADLLRARPDVTAIFACNDLLATLVIQTVREHGLSVPDDLSIIGFDNTIHASIVHPSLTTVAQPIENMGKQAVDLLLGKINDPDITTRKVILLPELIVRSSVTAPGKE